MYFTLLTSCKVTCWLEKVISYLMGNPDFQDTVEFVVDLVRRYGLTMK